MAQPNNGLITETNSQYYSGVQMFQADGTQYTYPTTFDTDLVFYNYSPTDETYGKNNFKLFISSSGLPGSFTEYITSYTVSNNIITLPVQLALGTFVAVQLKNEFGGNYGDLDAYGDVVEKNYGSYAYISVKELVDNFLIAYVGTEKLIPSVKTGDIIFHTKRALQEFSYDTLPSIRSQELTIPDNLSVPLPQDYVNYVNVSWIDSQGVKHVIYPTSLTGNPYTKPIQDKQGVAIQDNFAENLKGTSQIEDKWKSNQLKQLNEITSEATGLLVADGYYYGLYGTDYWGQRFGLQPQTSQYNGWFTINHRDGKMSFSSDLLDKLILFEYISDGLGYDEDMKVPKLAEEAVYAYVSHAILASRVNQPEYVVQRLRREKSAKLRNAKIRLSNIKSNEIVQVMRGNSKWIKT